MNRSEFYVALRGLGAFCVDQLVCSAAERGSGNWAGAALGWSGPRSGHCCGKAAQLGNCCTERETDRAC